MSALSFDRLSIRVGSRALLDGVSFEVAPGEFVALVGPNGAGKTTLLRGALGLVPATSGHVGVGGRRVEALSARERAAEIAWLPQQPLTPEPISVLDTVLAARYRFAETVAAARSSARAALARVDLRDFESALLTELSGGERQRVAIAALLAQGAHFLLVDEPANHLDPARQAETYRLLGSLSADGAGVLCVTHDVNLLVHLEREPRVVGVAEGRVRFDVRFGASELPDRLAELFGVPMHVARIGDKRLVVPLPNGAARGST